jgi:methionyl-tRNA formyltransferase
VQTIKDVVAGKIEPIEQDPSLVTYVKKLTKADGLIDWTREAVYLERFVRAMSPWPSAWTWMSGRQLKILAISEIIELDTYKPGKVFVYNNQLAIQTGKGAVIVSRLQAEGKRPMSSQEFVNGYGEIVGVVLS